MLTKLFFPILQSRYDIYQVCVLYPNIEVWNHKKTISHPRTHVSFHFITLTWFCRARRGQQVDQTFNKMVLDSIQGTLPVRVGSMNMCYAPSFFKVIWVVISTFLHEWVFVLTHSVGVFGRLSLSLSFCVCVFVCVMCYVLSVCVSSEFLRVIGMAVSMVHFIMHVPSRLPFWYKYECFVFGNNIRSMCCDISHGVASRNLLPSTSTLTFLLSMYLLGIACVRLRWLILICFFCPYFPMALDVFSLPPFYFSQEGKAEIPIHQRDGWSCARGAGRYCCPRKLATAYGEETPRLSGVAGGAHQGWSMITVFGYNSAVVNLGNTLMRTLWQAYITVLVVNFRTYCAIRVWFGGVHTLTVWRGGEGGGLEWVLFFTIHCDFTSKVMWATMMTHALPWHSWPSPRLIQPQIPCLRNQPKVAWVEPK